MVRALLSCATSAIRHRPERDMTPIFKPSLLLAAVLLIAAKAPAADLPVVSVEGQPLGANVGRVLDALAMLGRPLLKESAQKLADAMKERDAARIQSLLDPHVLLAVAINPESRVKVLRGPA